MKRLILPLASLALLIIPNAVNAAAIDPVQLTLDNPNQAVTAPSSGITMVNFSGTLFVEEGWFVDLVALELPYNASQTSFLSGNFDDNFVLFIGGGSGTY